MIVELDLNLRVPLEIVFCSAVVQEVVIDVYLVPGILASQGHCMYIIIIYILLINFFKFTFMYMYVFLFIYLINEKIL